MLRSHVAGALCTLLFSATAAAQGRQQRFAQEKQHRFELGAYGGYMFGGSAEGESDLLRTEASIEAAPSYGGFVDVAVRPNAYVELSYSRQPTELTLDQSNGMRSRYDFLVQYLQLGGLLEFRTPSADWLRPVFGGTLGATVFSADDGQFSYEEWRFSFILEGGAKFRITNFLGLRLRARAFFTFLTDESAVFCAAGGCALAYSGTVVLQGEVGAGAYVAF